MQPEQSTSSATSEVSASQPEDRTRVEGQLLSVASPTAPPLRVLLVEDDAVDRMAVRRALRSFGKPITIDEAADAATAQRLLLNSDGVDYDCALLDYFLPDADGLTILRRIRAAGVKTPVIMMTGQGSEEVAVEIMKAGATDYLAKSRVSLDGLSRSIDFAVRVHRAESDAARSAARLRESEERFRAMADNAPVLIWVSDPGGRRDYFNQPWLEFTGRTLEQEVGEGWAEGIFPDDRERYLKVYHDHFGERKPFEVEYRHRRSEGQFRWVFDKGTPRFLPDGTFAGYIGSCIDVTERRQTEEALRETNLALAALIQASPLAIYSVDPDGIVKMWNAAAQRIFGWTQEEALGQYLPIVPDDRRTEADALRARILAGEKVSGLEALRRRKDGSPIYISISAAPLYGSDGRTMGIVGVTSDITDRKRAEKERAQLLQNAQTARAEAEAAREAAEAANIAKDQFLAVLSHELRTPLTPVLTEIASLQTEQLPPEHREALEMIRRNVELEARLIDDLLDLTRIAKGKLDLDLQPINAGAALESALEICRPEVDAKKLNVRLDCQAESPFVRADPARLQQVFWNLIKNATKFTPEGGSIAIRMENPKGAPGLLAIEISDTGIGIEPALLPRIFDAFEQGERSVTRRFGGLGLGLAISKSLMDMHGAVLRASSAGKDQGSTFAIEIATVAAPAPSATPPPARGTSTPEGLHILLVDDHEDTSRAMKRLLSRRGYHITTAGSVADALSADAQATSDDHPFDLLISDIGLPDGSGLDLMRQLLARRPVKGITLSGFGMEEDIRKSRAAGFSEHLTKPINFQRLEAAIQHAVSP